MSKLIDNIQKIPDKRIGHMIKNLCCNCLEENRIVHPITGEKICYGCGARDFKTFRLQIYMIPEATGCEL